MQYYLDSMIIDNIALFYIVSSKLILYYSILISYTLLKFFGVILEYLFIDKKVFSSNILSLCKDPSKISIYSDIFYYPNIEGLDAKNLYCLYVRIIIF